MIDPKDDPYYRLFADAMGELPKLNIRTQAGFNRSIGVARALADQAVRTKVRDAAMQVRNTDASRKKASAAASVAWSLPERREYLSTRAATTWANEEVRDKRIRGMKKAAAELPAEKKAEKSRNVSKAQLRPCTIDGGVTVYPSLSALAQALGWGKNGARSPSFTYLDGKPKRAHKRGA